MKKTTLAALLGATALVLSACGGGGGSSSPNTSANNTVPNNNNNNANNNGNANNNNGGNANIGKNTATDFKSVQASQLDKLTVGGVTISLTGLRAGTWFNNNNSNGNYAVGGTTYSSVRFGFAGKSVNNRTPFVHGVETTNMPTNGQFKYSGLHMNSDGKGAGFQGGKNSAELTADFGARKLTGTLTGAANETYQINADIKGNRFSGTAADKTYSEGGFYGNNAAEVAGSYKKGDITGVFGAQKQ